MKSTLLAALLFCAGNIFAADSPTVAVYDFKGEAGVEDVGSKVATLATADLTIETNIVMVERSELNKALSEQAFGASGMVSAEAAAKIGQMTGAKILIAGHVFKTGKDRVVIVANIIGTETGRLFAEKVEGAADDLMALTSDLSHKIARTIAGQTTNLMTPDLESRADFLNRILKQIKGTNRPSISVVIKRADGYPSDSTMDTELGVILLKAGFKVVDDNSEIKPDLEITGGSTMLALGERGGLFFCSFGVDVKIRERKTGSILAFEHQDATATASGQVAAGMAAQIKIIDELAERVLPLLTK